MLSKFFEFKDESLKPIKSFYIKDDLNPKIWDDFELNEDIREDLLKIAQDFYNSIEIPAEVVDIVFCGSLCNYNWSEEYSDYDLHIIINFRDVDENLDLVEKLCDYAKKNWNSNHDIFLKGYEVEVAVQDSEDLKKSIRTNSMGGVYSLIKNKWVKRPEKIEFIPNEKLISEKAKTIIQKIDDIEDQIYEDKYESIDKKIKKVWKKIKDLRKSGLDSEGGEFSIGNLVFKLLRRNGYISKIMSLKKESYDKQFENKKNI